MIDHTGVMVSNFEVSKRFYTAALAPIGYQLIMEVPSELTGHGDAAGFGEPPKPDFWIGAGTPNVPPIHIAFRVTNRTLVDAFYKAAIAAVARTMAHRACARITTRTTTAPSSSIRTVTTSRRFATR